MMKIYRDQLAMILYWRDPAVIHDRVDDDCTMPWNQAVQDQPQQYLNAYHAADLIFASSDPFEQIVKIVGRHPIFGEMASFTSFSKIDWFAETRFGNFHWKNPYHGDGDNTFTYFAGGYRDFCTHMSVRYGRDRRTRRISDVCGRGLVVKIGDEIIA